MGTLVGHVLPGFAFLALGLWHLFNNIKLFCLHPNTFTSSIWFPVSKLRHLELYFIMFSSLASISMELFIGPRRHHPFDLDGTIPSNHLRNFEHSSISMFFLVHAVFALVLDRARPRAASFERLTILVAAAAFAQELLLFHFHSTDHIGVEGQYHLILQLIIFVSLLTTLMGIALPKSFMVSFVRSSSIAFQGVWLIVIGCMLYTPSLIPKGCYIHHNEELHLVVNCITEESLHRAKSLVNLEFSWLFVTHTIFVLVLYLIMDRVYGENIEYSGLTSIHQTVKDDDEEQLFESKSTQGMCFVQMGKLVEHGQKM